MTYLVWSNCDFPPVQIDRSFAEEVSRSGQNGQPDRKISQI